MADSENEENEVEGRCGGAGKPGNHEDAEEANGETMESYTECAIFI